MSPHSQRHHMPNRLEIILIYIALVITAAVIATLIQPGGPF